ncbi:MAG TPA: hypothetical protein VE008_00620 [Burkholderiales bacterium]|nr:hypothetical protein [Burkholderiales bacterium]
MIVHPMMRGSLRLRFLLLSAFTLVLALAERSALADPSDCIEDPTTGIRSYNAQLSACTSRRSLPLFLVGLLLGNKINFQN